jgi:hypothetical protein
MRGDIRQDTWARRRWLRGVLFVVASVAVGVVGVVGCSRASDELDSKRSPATPPPREVHISDTLHIEVVIDGVAEAPLTAPYVRGIKPDFADSERRGWLISTLIPKAAKAKVVIAEGPSGVGLRLEALSGSGLAPALLLTRRGDVIVGAVDPSDPFPRYHGQGGRLKRIGDPMPRLSPVTRLQIQHETSAQ